MNISIRMRLIFRLVVLFFLIVVFQNFSLPGSMEKFETIYSIQVASLAREIPPSQIKQQNNLSEDVELVIIGGRYKYFIGRFTSRSEATAYLRNVNVNGAYVVSREIGPAAESITKTVAQQQTPAQTTRNQYFYYVQIAASREEMPAGFFD